MAIINPKVKRIKAIVFILSPMYNYSMIYIIKKDGDDVFIKKCIVGNLDTNCYILENKSGCLIIDPGAEADKIIREISLPVQGIIVTHYHDDHIGALEEIKSYYKAPVFDHNSLADGINKIGDFTFEVIFNPGHTMDSISLYFKEEKSLFCGDFIFYQSIGRTDLGGSPTDMKESLKNILSYPDDTIIYPGHYEKTSLGNERDNLNFFISML